MERSLCSRNAEDHRSAGWVAILVAGLLEIAWAHSINQTAGFTKLLPTIVCGVLTIAVMLTLNFAMKTLPVGTAYAVFTGIGAVGTAIVGMVLLDEPITFGRVTALVLIVSGVVLLHLTDASASDAT